LLLILFFMNSTYEPGLQRAPECTCSVADFLKTIGGTPPPDESGRGSEAVLKMEALPPHGYQF
jgi:hypothetical protein